MTEGSLNPSLMLATQARILDPVKFLSRQDVNQTFPVLQPCSWWFFSIYLKN